MSSLNEKEIALLNQLSQSSSLISQRTLAEKSGVSIGLINAVLRKLIHDGYVKACAVNQKRLKYLLTRKGMSHIIERSYQKIIRTVRQYHQLENDIELLMTELIQNGGHKLCIHGDEELKQFISSCIKKKFKAHPITLSQTNGDPETIHINLSQKPLAIKGRKINLIKDLMHNRLDKKENRDAE